MKSTTWNLLFVICALTPVCSPLPEFKQTHNTLFIAQGDIHTSAHSWSISFYVNITDYIVTADKLIDDIQNYLLLFRSLDSIQIPETNNVRDAYTELLMHEYTALYNVLADAEQLQHKISNLSRLCISDCHTKRKRSVLPVVSSIFELLFGFATRHKQELIEQQLKKMATNEYNIMHVVENSLTVLDKTSMAVQANRDMLNNLTDVISEMSTDLDQTTFFINNTIIPFQKVMFRTKQLSVTKSAFQHAYVQLLNAVNELHDQISHLFQGHISISILPPGLLRFILRNIKFRMPSGLSLPYDPDSDLAPYYKLFSVHIQSANVGFLATATIPIYDATSSFTVYKSVHVPIFLDVNDTYVQATATYNDGNSYFALSQDSNKIIFLNEAIISFCMSQELHFCFVHSATFQVAQLTNNCIVDLFFETDNIHNSCHTEISPRSLHDPVSTFLFLNTWSISSTIPMTFTFLCKNGSSEFLVQPPMTIIRLPSGCDATSSSISLVNQIPFESDISLPPYVLNVTALSFIWKPLHDKLRKFPNDRNLKIPNKLGKLVQFHRTIPSLINAYNPEIVNKSHSSITIIISILITLLIISSVYPIYKLIMFIRKRSPTENRIENNLIPQDNPVGLSLTSLS